MQFCSRKSSRVHRLVKSNFIVESVFWLLQDTKNWGWQMFWGLEGLLLTSANFVVSKKWKKKKTNPTIPFDRRQKTKQKSYKNHSLEILCFWDIHVCKLCKIRTQILQTRYRKHNILKTTDRVLLRIGRYTYNIVCNQKIGLWWY